MNLSWHREANDNKTVQQKFNKKKGNQQTFGVLMLQVYSERPKQQGTKMLHLLFKSLVRLGYWVPRGSNRDRDQLGSLTDHNEYKRTAPSSQIGCDRLALHQVNSGTTISRAADERDVVANSERHNNLGRSASPSDECEDQKIISPAMSNSNMELDSQYNNDTSSHSMTPALVQLHHTSIAFYMMVFKAKLNNTFAHLNR
ncbi:uncharacterized protein LACBIDRAFT_326274 [Laccaria bicolor S238N-H82]|uniref:Predicted protein n=1 Tax=Laccaria bicolor (strain S238N-H82 / ATCC MYA-4686) TaxID=486041 RepID=B0D7W7_LACBS|nr:uncharacterized protein LACBIDRAFT_326274 [Laccaria bicolor S238N-H82]EDR09715.1 predicted protein [Laccaria bicolor S238N-H82]|eukprot:XP_001880064.1 predicted protein [Laccaria bicolor S238N-H82]